MPTNFDINEITATVGTAETTIAHTLGRVPRDGFIVLRGSNATVWRGPTAWTSSTIHLQASATVSITIILF